MKPTAQLLFFALFGACTEYKINPDGDAIGSDSDEPIDTEDPIPVDTGTVVVDACEDFEDPADATISLNTECEVELSEGTFTPVIEWSYGSSAFCGPAAVGQLIDTNGSGVIDDDDMPIIVLYQSSSVVALYGDSGTVAWTARGTYGQDGGFAIGDLDDDGFPEVITASGTTVCSLSGQDGTENWCKAGLGASMDSLGYNYPAIADMDGTGNPLITVGNAILAANGSLLGTGAFGKGAAPYGGTGTSTYGTLSAPVDLDGDGVLELVTGNAAYDSRGATIWANGGIDGLVAVADFDGDGEGEIVKTSGIYVTGMESDGSTAWGPLTFSGNLGAPAIDDLDGDGTPEFVFAAQNQLIAMEWGGAYLWRATINDSSGAAGPVLFDFEMDGYPEVLYADETQIRFFSGLDGSVKYASGNHASYTILETPIVADVDNDDQVEIVLGHCNGNASIGALTVYGDADETWPPGRKIWNQHAYYINNIDDMGGVPSTNTSNWPTYNSFRSGDIGLPPGEYLDVTAYVLDVCEDECDGGKVYVAARLGNAGNIELPAGVSVTLRAGVGGEVLDVEVTTEAIASGSTGEVLHFEANGADIAGTTPIVTADEDAEGLTAIYECEESNNIEAWTGTVCD